MKKIVALCLALMMLMAFALPVCADEYVSPTAPTIPDAEDKEPTAPQTGYNWVVLAGGIAVAGIAAAAVVGKKLSAEG